MQIHAGQFENVAKMSRLAPTKSLDVTPSSQIIPVKLRSVFYQPQPVTPNPPVLSDSDTLTDRSIPIGRSSANRKRPVSSKNSKLFYRVSTYAVKEGSIICVKIFLKSLTICK